MTTRACTVCGTPCIGPRCPAHGGNRRTMTTTQRGYGAAHQQRRALLLASAIGQACPICRQPMLAGQALDLDHTVPLIVDAGSRGDRMAHAQCNRGDGGRSRTHRAVADPASRSREIFARENYSGVEQ